MDGSVIPRPRVLLVDDCGDQRDLYELLLAAEADTAVAGRGSEAIAVAVAQHPDVIVLDIEMPGLDGFATCRLLKTNPATASIPVILLTGADYLDAEAQLAGAYAILRKPCPERLLLDAIASAIGGQAR